MSPTLIHLVHLIRSRMGTSEQASHSTIAEVATSGLYAAVREESRMTGTTVSACVKRESVDPLYAELYAGEWKRRDQLQSAISTPFALLSALAGGEFFVFQRAVGFEGSAGVVEGLGLSVAALCLMAALAALLISFVGHEYESIPLATELLSYKAALREFHRANASGSESVADEEFAADLGTRYAEAAAANHLVNNRRAEWLHRSNVAMVSTLPFLVLAAVPVAISMGSKPTTAQRVQLITNQPIEVRMTDPNETTPTPNPTPPTTTDEQKRPVMPPNHGVRGGSESPQGGRNGRGGGGSGTDR